MKLFGACVAVVKSRRENSSVERSRRYPTPLVINSLSKGAKVACASNDQVVTEFLLSEKLASVKVEGLPVRTARGFCGAAGFGIKFQLLPALIGEVSVSSGKEYFWR